MAFVPDEMIMESASISPTALRLALFYCKCADKKTGECWPSLREAAKRIGVRLDHTKRYDEELVSKRWISIRRDKKRGRIVTVIKGWDRRGGFTPAHQNLGIVLPHETQNREATHQNLGNSHQNLGGTTWKEPCHEPAQEPVLAAAAPPEKKVAAVSPQETASQVVVLEAMAKVCQIDWRNCSPRVAKQLGAAHRRYRGMFTGKPDTALVAGLEAFGAWWFSQDWRGKRNQPPEPMQVIDLWPRFKLWHKSDPGRTQPFGRST